MTPPPDVRAAAVAGSFYPARPDAVRAAVAACLAAAPGAAPEHEPIGALVPHAGLVYSGAVAAAGWRTLLEAAPAEVTVVILGTNHSAWFDGVAVYDAGAWRTPLGDVAVDDDVAARVVALGEPFGVSRPAHLGEHAIEVQLPLLQTIRPGARIVPCSVAAGTGPDAIEAGRRLGELLARLRGEGVPVRLAISTDMAHYPVHGVAAEVTERLLPHIAALDPVGLARQEALETASGVRGLVCGMCGVQPSVLGLAAVRAMGATVGTRLAAATSADAGGPPERTVGYLAVGFS